MSNNHPPPPADVGKLNELFTKNANNLLHSNTNESLGGELPKCTTTAPSLLCKRETELHHRQTSIPRKIVPSLPPLPRDRLPPFRPLPDPTDSTLKVSIGASNDGKKDDAEGGQEAPYTVDSTTGFWNQYSFK